MSRPWMALYVGDYLADTAHLRAVEHGVYLLLIMHYWRTKGLPEDDSTLARIGRVNLKEWKKMKPTIQAFFHDGWKHKRIDQELEEAEKISEAGRKGGLASAEARRNRKQTTVERSLQDRSNDQPTNGQAPQPQPQPQSKNAANAAPDLEADLFRRGREVLGKSSGGMVKQLLTAKDGKVNLARAAIETAAGKNNPREYIGAIIRNRDPPPDSANMRVDPRL